MEPLLFLTKHSQLGLKAKYYFWRSKEERHRVPLETQSHDSMHKTLLLLEQFMFCNLFLENIHLLTLSQNPKAGL